jgi:lipopolysaccharide exporter
MKPAVKNNGWLLAGFFNGMQKLSIPIFGIISTMVLAHKALTKTEMGVWSLFLVVTSFVEIIRQSLVKTSLIKYVNHTEQNKQKYVLSAAFFLNSIVTLLLLVVLLIFASYFSFLLNAPALKPMLYIFFVGMLLLIPFSHFEWIMYSKSQFKGLFWTYFFRQGISLLLMVLFVFFDAKPTLNQLVIFYCIGIFTGMLVAYKFVKEHFEHTFIFSSYWLKQLWHFGKYVFGTGLSSLVFANASQVMLSPILGSTIFTASQSVATRVINLADIPSQVLSDLLFPKSARKENAGNKDVIKFFYEKAVGATLCFNIPVVLFILIFPKFIIFVLAGPKYYDAIPYLQIISISGIFLTFLKQFGVIMDATGKPQINFFAITFIAVVHIVFTYFFIKYFGFLGAAYALIPSHIIGFIISQAILYRHFKIKFLSCFKYAVLFYPELFKTVLDRQQWKTN